MRIAIVLVLLLVFRGATAQMTVKKYFTRNNEPTDAEHSFYYEVGKKVLMLRGETSKWVDTVYVDTVKTFYSSSNTLRSRTIYREGDREGPYNVYHLNGKLKEKGFYKKDKKIGYVIYWTDAGTLKQTLQYFYREKFTPNDSFKIISYHDSNRQELVKNGFGYFDGDLFETGLIEKGKIVNGYRDSVWHINTGDSVMSLEVYRNGVFISGESTYKGKRFTYEKIIEQAEFPGQAQAMYKFLQKNQQYPSAARWANIQGKVFVKFTIDRVGNIGDIRVIRSLDKILDQEAVRLIKISPKWVPGKLRGVPSKSDFVLPVYFKLES